MYDVMYKRRLKGYASVGYKILQNDSKDLSSIDKSVIFTGKNYQESFFTDFSRTCKSVIISTAKLWFTKRAPILELLTGLSAQGVEVIVFIRQLSDKDQPPFKVRISFHTDNCIQLHVDRRCEFDFNPALRP